MPDYGDLKPEDLYKASALAAELHARDVEKDLANKADAEAGIPAEYMESSVAALRRDRSRRALLLRVGIPCALTAVLLTALAWRQWGAHRNVSAPLLAVQPLLASVLPAPETSQLSVLPVPKSGIGQLSDPGSDVDISFLVGIVTSITFSNRTSHSVSVYHLNAGAREFARQVPAGGQYIHQTIFGAPWLITGDHGRSMGICFAPDVPSTVDITDSASRTPGLSDGYLMPLQASDAATPNPPPTTADDSSSTLIEFVNMMNQPVNLYGSLNRGGGQTFEAQVNPGDTYDSLTYQGNLWLATDSSRKVLYRFVASIVPRVAILLPRHDK
jgi:hypothetical protein